MTETEIKVNQDSFASVSHGNKIFARVPVIRVSTLSYWKALELKNATSDDIAKFLEKEKKAI